VFSNAKEGGENKQIVDEKLKVIKNGFRYRVLFEEYNVDHCAQYSYMLYFVLSRLVYAIILVFMYEHSDWQLFTVETMIAIVSEWLS